MDKREHLNEFVAKYSRNVYLTSKAEIVEHYKDKYGEKTWKSELAMSISGSTDKKSKEYRSAMRDFQGQRLNKEGKQGRYEAIGQKLPPIDKEILLPKGNSITVTVNGTQPNGRGGTRSRSITATFTGSAAYDFIQNPSYSKIYKSYWPAGGAKLFGGEDGGDDDDEEGADADYSIDVTSVV